jgi:hypothetical protein
MSFADKMEKKVFFKIVRWFALFVSFIGFISIIIGAFLFIQNFSNIFPSSKVKVEFNDVQAAVQSKDAVEKAAIEAANIEANNNIARAFLGQAYAAAVSFFRNQPMGSVASLEALKANGLIMDDNIEITIPVGEANGFKITAKHKKGDKTYSADASGYISELAPDTPPPPAAAPVSSKKEDVKDSKIENLINEVVNQFPQGTYDRQKIKEALQVTTKELNEDYKIQYLKDLNDVVKKAPVESMGKYAENFTVMFQQKVIEMTTNKEIKQLTALKNFAIYGGTIIGGILIIAIFGLILVLLAIERNTRKDEL